MQAEDFAAAWEVSDEVLRDRRDENCEHLPRHFQWIWRGESLAEKRVLIRCYHGLGDTIQFIRYAPLVRQRPICDCLGATGFAAAAANRGRH